MSADGSVTPRIAGRHLNNYIGKHVLLMVECLDTGGDVCSVKCCDGTTIRVSTQPGDRFQSKYAQILAKVNHPQAGGAEAEAFSIEEVSDNFDMENYDKLCDLMNGKYASLFV